MIEILVDAADPDGVDEPRAPGGLAAAEGPTEGPEPTEDGFEALALAVGADAIIDELPDLAGPAEADAPAHPDGDELDDRHPAEPATSDAVVDGAAGSPGAVETSATGSAAPAAFAAAPPTGEALAALYPRVKRPTSVPAMAMSRMRTSAALGLVTRTPVGTPPNTGEGEVRSVAMRNGPATIRTEPALDLDARVIGAWPERLAPMSKAAFDEEAARTLLVLEREIPTIDEPVASAGLHVEAGRLYERVGDIDHAREHYDAALLADPRATTALRGLRRIARASGDLVEATRQLDAEIAVAGALERRPLSHYRVDLLLASGDNDLARVAVGELLDTAPSDVRALFAQLELAFLDGRADEFGRALERLALAVTDRELQEAVQLARGVLASRPGSEPLAPGVDEVGATSIAARLAAIRGAASRHQAGEHASSLRDLAQAVLERDPRMAAALALRAQDVAREAVGPQAASIATRALTGDPVVARLAAESCMAASDLAGASAALAAWATSAAPAHERSYAVARAAELDAERAAELWATLLSLEPENEYAAAQLRTAHVAAEQPRRAVDVDRRDVPGPSRERAQLRAATGLVREGAVGEAIELLERAHVERPTSGPLVDALADALAVAGRWTDRASVLAALAAHPGDHVDRDVAQLRSALAWESAVGAIATSLTPDPRALSEAITHALAAWERVDEQAGGTAPGAHAAAAILATRLGDRAVIDTVLARTQRVEKAPWAASSIALRRARAAAGDPARALAILEEAPPQSDDPRRAVALLLAAARAGTPAHAVTVLEDYAASLGATSEAAMVGLRAAQLAFDAGDPARASGLLRSSEAMLPDLGVVSELLNAARRRTGEGTSPARVSARPGGPSGSDHAIRAIREGDDAAASGDYAGAQQLYLAALEARPGDPLVLAPLERVARRLRDVDRLLAVAADQLRGAEALEDPSAQASAHELRAYVERELRGDRGAALSALERAALVDATRLDLLLRLQREHLDAGRAGDLLRLRRAELAQVPGQVARDRAALLADAAALAERAGMPDVALRELCRDTIAADPRQRLALHLLEMLLRRETASVALATVQEQIAGYFGDDVRARASFLTRAGEVLAELGQLDDAAQRFREADERLPGHAPALESWRAVAIAAERWLDVAETATRQARASGEPQERARLHHLAAVALMDKAFEGDRAQHELRAALDADPGHRDAFIRLRILLEEEGNHDELALLLGARLEHEPDGPQRVELHRALAELSRNFLNDREGAKKHYRAILEADPADRRALSAIADIAWEQGAWQEAADTLVARARLERDRSLLKSLCYRIGLIYADRLGDVAMALKVLQRGLTYQPDDEQTLDRLAELATQAGEWTLALAACERLVTAEQDPERRAAHLHRVARVLKVGFGDVKRAERALNLALDSAPASDEALGEIVRFYRDAGDMVSVRVHLNRVSGTMRVRAATDPGDGVAYRVISRAMAARAAVGVDGSSQVARAAAELAQLLGAGGEPERLLLAEPARIDLAPLSRPDVDEVLFPPGAIPELRQMFTLMGERLAKHVGVDLRAYGVSRGDRLRARDSSVAAHAQEVATGLGLGEVEVYVTTKQPYAMVAEPSSPVSLVLGQAIAERDSHAVRFAAGAALKLAQSHVAIPARLAVDDLGVLVVALMRLFQDKFPRGALDEHAIAAQSQKLKRLIPNNLLGELRLLAVAIDGAAFDHRVLSRDLQVAGLRAGLVASGTLMAGLELLAAKAGTDVAGVLIDPIARGLVSFAISEDHATVCR